MSTGIPESPDASATPPGAVPVYNVPPPGTGNKREVDHIVIYGHSNLLYWWPVWLVAFVLAGVTYFEGNQMAVVPPGTQAVEAARVEGFDGPRAALVAPPDARLPQYQQGDGTTAAEQPHMTVSSSNSLGVVFATTLVLVALISTLTFRGLVSVIIILGMIAVVIALAFFGLWDDILNFFGGVDIRMNAAGYLFIAIPLFLAWAFVVFVYDKQIYMVFDEGQIRYVLDVGDGATVAPSEGAMVEKKRADVFRHWLLGFGTGDIIVKTGDGKKIELENVINIGGKLPVINDMLRHKPIVVEAA
jgi:hypothetical protein